LRNTLRFSCMWSLTGGLPTGDELTAFRLITAPSLREGVSGRECCGSALLTVTRSQHAISFSVSAVATIRDDGMMMVLSSTDFCYCLLGLSLVSSNTRAVTQRAEIRSPKIRSAMCCKRLVDFKSKVNCSLCKSNKMEDHGQCSNG